MKTESKIIFAMFFIFFTLFMIGFRIHNQNFNEFTITGNIIEANETIVTEEMALEAISEAESIREEMVENNFSTGFIGDVLLEAGRELERVRYAEILRDSNSSNSDLKKARDALQLIDWEELTYASVLVHTDKIKERKKQAFDIHDLLLATEINLETYADDIDIKEIQKKLDEARNAFYEERYEDSQTLIGETKELLEAKIVQTANVNGMLEGTKNFIKKNWIVIILSLMIVGGIGFFSYRKIVNKLLNKKIIRMRIEKKILLELMKKTQIERFKEKRISEMVYNIRMEKYQKRLNDIKEILPVLEEKSL